jgi:hypothetical protein
MKFTRIVYGLAAAYGFVSLLPLYFLIEKLGNDAPSAITDPEFYYGFVGLALLWQVVFVLIARTPIRYRSIMLIAIAEKFVYTVPVLVLYSLGQVHSNVAQSSLLDPLFGVLFIVAYFRVADTQTRISDN